jgi:hypothetical protein
MYCLIYLLALLVSSHYQLDAVNFNDLQDLEPEDFEQREGEQGK